MWKGPIFCKPQREFTKPKFKNEDGVPISKYDWHFKKGYKPQFTHEVFQIFAISSRKPPTYTINDEKDEIIRGKFLSERFEQSHLTMDSYTLKLVSNAFAQLFPDNRLSSFTNFSIEQLNLEGRWEVAISEVS